MIFAQIAWMENYWKFWLGLKSFHIVFRNCSFVLSESRLFVGSSWSFFSLPRPSEGRILTSNDMGHFFLRCPIFTEWFRNPILLTAPITDSQTNPSLFERFVVFIYGVNIISLGINQIHKTIKRLCSFNKIQSWIGIRRFCSFTHINGMKLKLLSIKCRMRNRVYCIIFQLRWSSQSPKFA